MKNILLTLAIGVFTLSSCSEKNESTLGNYLVKPIPFNKVKVTDNFWSKRIQTNIETTIPIAFAHCESTGRIRNFEIAGGILKGTIERPKTKQVSTPRLPNEFQTDSPFDDSDVFKILEGVGYALASSPQPKLEAYADSIITIISAAQEPDGYLYTYRTIMGDNSHPWIGSKRWELTHILSHELYNLGHLYEAAVAYYQGTGKRKLLDIALKSADLLCKDFGWDKYQGYPGHQEVEIGLVKLYNVTHEQRYLDLAKFFLDVRGRSRDIPVDKGQGTYDQSHKPVTEQTEAVGHSVRAVYMYTGMADVAALTKNEDYVKAMKTLWQDIAYTKLYITGGIGASGGHEGFGAKYELPNPSAYCETCAAIGNIFWNYRLFLGEGDSKYIDVLERSLYNNVLSGVAITGDQFFYPNPLESLNGGWRSKWFGCACCPSNVCRFIPAIPGYIYAVTDRDIYVNLYIPGNTTVELQSVDVSIEQKGNMPWDGYSEININPQHTARFSVKVRIPGWAREEAGPDHQLYNFADKGNLLPSVKVNGEKVNLVYDKGYVSINRQWKQGDVIAVDLPMEIRRIHANEKVEADRNKVALQRGPIVYCSEGVDYPEERILDMVLKPNDPLESQFEKDIVGGVVTISGIAHHSSRNDSSVVLTDEMPFKALPYYAWCHRGLTPMQVWYAENINAARPKPAPTIAALSKIEGSFTGGIEAIRDQILPSGSGDTNNAFFHWWPRSNQTEYIIYNFDKPYSISMAKVFWFSDGGGCKVPKAWRIYYKNTKGEWILAKNITPYNTQVDIINQTKLESITTTAMKLEVDLPEHCSSGIHEWILE